QYWTSSCLADSFVPLLPYAISYSSDRGFASGLLQIPPHDGHPCLLLTVPTAKPVYGNFHHQVIVHAGHTKKHAHPCEIVHV
ncbi:MAG: hypothetical protein LBH37_04080, partial [Oscillospiraceae bacterium]|nr:hypothetical protein [Oscillospiraceae bacterium]